MKNRTNPYKKESITSIQRNRRSVSVQEMEDTSTTSYWESQSPMERKIPDHTRPRTESLRSNFTSYRDSTSYSEQQVRKPTTFSYQETRMYASEVNFQSEKGWDNRIHFMNPPFQEPITRMLPVQREANRILNQLGVQTDPQRKKTGQTELANLFWKPSYIQALNNTIDDSSLKFRNIHPDTRYQEPYSPVKRPKWQPSVQSFRESSRPIDRNEKYQSFRDKMHSGVRNSVYNAVETSAYVGTMASKGGKSLVSSTGQAIRSTASSVATQLNRYTPDIYDVGRHGQADLTSDAGMFMLGNAAMIGQNAARMSRFGGKYAVKLTDKALHNSWRMNKLQQKSEFIKNRNSKIKMTYSQILTGQSRKDVLHYKDRLAWNRFVPNEAKNLMIRERSTLLWKKWRSNRYNRVLKNSNQMKIRFKRMKATQFSLYRSTKGMFINQSRKLSNMAVNGNDPSSTSNRTIWMAQKGIRGGVRTAKALYKKRQMIAKFGKSLMHPVQSAKAIVTAITTLISGILSLVASLPIVASIIAILLPLLVIIMCVFTVITTVLGWFTTVDRYGNVEMVATRDYAANAFIYEAKERGWKSEAIEGVLAYMLAENLSEMGTFTYESFWVVKGPGGEYRDKTLDNEAWLEWLQGDGKAALRNTSYATRGDIYCAIAIGLLADSDVWATSSSRSSQNATNLINYCEGKGQPWQDPKTQLTYYFENIFTRDGVFDTSGVDPAKDNRSAEEWCRRITAGYGMPAWSWTTNNTYMQAHIAKLDLAKQYVDNYKFFSYVSLTGGNITSSPDFSNEQAWRHPYNNYPYGQCTWFAAGRLYEIYGIRDNTLGDGKQWVSNLTQRYPDKFKFSTEPAAGAIFCTGGTGQNKNHVGLVIGVEGDTVIVQEGNFNGTTDSWEVAITDWKTMTYTKAYMQSMYGAIYAVPF